MLSTFSSSSLLGSKSNVTIFILHILVGVLWYLIMVILCIPWWLMLSSIFSHALCNLYSLFREIDLHVFYPFSNWFVWHCLLFVICYCPCILAVVINSMRFKFLESRTSHFAGTLFCPSHSVWKRGGGGRRGWPVMDTYHFERQQRAEARGGLADQGSSNLSTQPGKGGDMDRRRRWEVLRRGWGWEEWARKWIQWNFVG